MSEVKKTFKYPKNHVGYISKSKAGNIMLTVEQDVTLKAGDKLIQRKPADVIDGLVANGILDEAKGEERKSKIPDWKLYEVSVMKFDDK